MKILLLLLVSFLGFSCLGQKILVLYKPGKVKRVLFHEGDEIKVKLKDDKILSGVINTLNDSTFVLGGDEVMLSRIKSVIKERGFFKYSGKLFKIGGVFYSGITAVNSVIDPKTDFNSSAVIATTGLLGTGFILSFFKERKYRLDRQCSLRILNVTMEAPKSSGK